MWTYAMAHPILFFMMVCFVALIICAVFENILRTFIILSKDNSVTVEKEEIRDEDKYEL